MVAIDNNHIKNSKRLTLSGALHALLLLVGLGCIGQIALAASPATAPATASGMVSADAPSSVLSHAPSTGPAIALAAPTSEASCAYQRGQTLALRYYYSPRMVLSMQQAHLAARAAQRLGLQWQAVYALTYQQQDDAPAQSEVQQALHTLRRTHPASWRVLRHARALAPQDGALLARAQGAPAPVPHFPQALVVQLETASGHVRALCGSAMVGAMPLVFWQQALAERVAPPTHRRAPAIHPRPLRPSPTR